MIDVDTWTLTIDGDVDQEISLSFDDLLEMPLIERDITLTCVSNEIGGPYVGGTRWTGVRLTDLLDRAGIGSTGADQILSTDVDGMTISTPLDLATDGRDAMIAIAMDGQALPRDHGYPARMVVPGLYGYVSACKWITRMTLTTYDEKTAYWTDRGWATDAPDQADEPDRHPEAAGATSRPARPSSAASPGTSTAACRACRCASTAASGRTPTLGADAGNDYWRQWYVEWDAGSAGPGQHTLAVRAPRRERRAAVRRPRDASSPTAPAASSRSSSTSPDARSGPDRRPGPIRRRTPRTEPPAHVGPHASPTPLHQPKGTP